MYKIISITIITFFYMSCDAIADSSTEIMGCTDSAACNYNSNATTDNNTCVYPEGTCDCNNLPLEGYCDCNGSLPNQDGECEAGSENLCIGSECFVINEFLASSEFCCDDESLGLYGEDFAEFYNKGDTSIDISGWGFGDNPEEISAIAPAGTILESGEYLIVWFTGEGDGLAEDWPQSSDKLSSDGETIYVEDAESNSIINYDFPAQTQDVSQACFPDGTQNWLFDSTPTPGATNGSNP